MPANAAQKMEYEARLAEIRQLAFELRVVTCRAILARGRERKLMLKLSAVLDDVELHLHGNERPLNPYSAIALRDAAQEAGQ